MPEADAFNRWLDDFQRQVDPALERGAQPALTTPEARQAQEAFDTWWKSEQEPVTSPAVAFAEAPPQKPRAESSGERVLPEEWPLQVERLADDRARLHQKNELAEAENRALRERLSQVQSEIADFETRLSRSRQSYEEHIQRLEAEAKSLADQAQGLRSDKSFLEASLNRAAQEHKTIQEEASLQRQRADQAERKLLEWRQQQLQRDAEVAELRETVASQNGALEELRRQASVFNQRAVEAKETTDRDLMALRQDLKMFLEEMRLVRHSIRKGE